MPNLMGFDAWVIAAAVVLMEAKEAEKEPAEAETPADAA